MVEGKVQANRAMKAQRGSRLIGELVNGLEKTHLHGASFLNRARNSRCTVITDLDTLNGAHRKPFPVATPFWKLVPRPRSKHEK